MLKENDALSLVKKAFPQGRVEFFVRYNNVYLYKVFDDSNPEEGDSDNFYSVDVNSGDIKEFSYMTDGDPVKLTNLWLAQKGEEPFNS